MLLDTYNKKKNKHFSGYTLTGCYFPQGPRSRLKKLPFRTYMFCFILECSFSSLKSLVSSVDRSGFSMCFHQTTALYRHFQSFIVWQICVSVWHQTNPDTSLLCSGLISSLGRIFIKLILSLCGLFLMFLLSLFVTSSEFWCRRVNASMKKWCTMYITFKSHLIISMWS